MSLGHSYFFFFPTYFWLSGSFSQVNKVTKLYLVEKKLFVEIECVVAVKGFHINSVIAHTL